MNINMKDLFDRLITISFEDYQVALKEIRTALDKGQKAEKLEDAEFFFLLRPYCWFMHEPGFQDIMDICEDALQTMMDNKDLLMEETNLLMGNEFMSVGTFLATYVDEGSYNPSGWKLRYASPEVAVQATAQKYRDKLQEDPEAAEKMNRLANLFSNIEGGKHQSYYILRNVGADYVSFLGTIIHQFPANDQTFILHALDAFPNNEEVIGFFNRYIEQTASDHLRETAQKYLDSLQ